MVYVLEQINEKQTSKTLKVTIPAEGIDMMGAIFNVAELGTECKGYADVTPAKQGYTLEITGGPIKNATAVDVAYIGAGTNEGNDGIYSTALFGAVHPGNTLNIHHITFENINIKNTNASGVGILVGTVGAYDPDDVALVGGTNGSVKISNVTIKNSSVVGHRSVGALVGSNQGFVELAGTITMDNVKVMTVGGRSGLLFGLHGNNDYLTFTNTATINAKNCAFEMYKCDQNTGNGLGLKNGQITSTCALANGGFETKTYGFTPNDIIASGYNHTLTAPVVNIIK